MNFSFSFKHMEVSPYLLKYTKKKVNEKTRKFISGPSETKVSFYTSRKKFGCHVSLAAEGFDYFVSAQQKDMYSAVNAVTIKLESQLRKSKEKRNLNRLRSTSLESAVKLAANSQSLPKSNNDNDDEINDKQDPNQVDDYDDSYFYDDYHHKVVNSGI